MQSDIKAIDQYMKVDPKEKPCLFNPPGILIMYDNH